MPLVCVLLTVLVGAAAFAVDLGQLYYAGVEVQTAADAAALAAARMRQWYPYATTAELQTFAAQTAALNRAAGQPVTVNAADVLPMAYNPATRALTAATWTAGTAAIQVTARVRVPSLLRGMLGDSARVVRREATAWVANVNGANCLRPISINYTRFYEEGVTHDARYTSAGTTAPDFVQYDISETNSHAVSARSFIFLPRGLRESTYESAGYASNGNYHPVDFAGGGASALTAQTAQAVGSSGCTSATAAVGDLKTAMSINDNAAVSAISAGMLTLCNRSGNAANAQCYDARGNVGVRARLLFSDSVAAPGQGYKLRVREVGVVRIMCYFQSSADVCNDVPMNEPAAQGTWSLAYQSGKRTGYPAGTMAVFFECPGTTAITPDVVLGGKPSITQRLLLVK